MHYVDGKFRNGNKEKNLMNKHTQLSLAPTALLCLLGITTVAHAYDPTTVYPVNVVQHTPRTHIAGSPYWGPSQWGFSMETDLLVYDNKGGHWGQGDMHETFDTPVTKPAYTYGTVRAADLNNFGNNGWWYGGSNFNAGVFTDYNSATISTPPTSSTANTGNDDWFTVNQTWQAYYGAGTTYWGRYQYYWGLNTMALDFRQTYYTRSPGY